MQMTQSDRIVPAERMLEGAGFEVRRPFPTPNLHAVGPFILLDHIGPRTVAPMKAVGAPTHPHAGLETITVLFEGGGRHKDSLGNLSITGPGEVQWMRAGKGIVHDEGPTEEIFQHGGRSHGVQLWLNMPGDHKHDDPDYRHLRVSDIPAITGAGVQISLIAGTHAGEIGPLETHSDPLLLAARLDAGAAYTFDLRPDHHHGVYLMTGAASLRAGEPAVQEGELALVASATASLTVTGGETGAHLIVFGGPPIEDTLVRYGPFVANSQAHMHDIIRAYQAGRFGAIPQD